MNTVMLFCICFFVGLLISFFAWVLISFILSMSEFSIAKMFSSKFMTHVIDEIKFAFSWKLTIFGSLFIGWIFFDTIENALNKREMQRQEMCTCKCEVCKKVASIVLSTNIVNEVTK